ncbi:hypothetical protein B0O99DRAFT_589855 [Bisporella sp. PMI_857]|nr:hypothetical protein B0O99DRAFT_589855 [Bisporella sp. PMI_857]
MALRFAVRQTGSSTSTADKTSTETPTPTQTVSLGTISSLSTATSTSLPKKDDRSGPNSTTIAAISISIAAVLILTFIWYILRRTRNNHKNPKYVPTKFLKKLWEKWEPDPLHYRLPDTNDHLEPHRTADLSRSVTRAPPSLSAAESGNATVVNNAAPTTGIDRNTSVRSVMTLPAYNPNARENEQVLGREGERGGIDVVIEFPEGVDEEEERREAEMEALYQVRLARRRENEERDERRRLRREARERGDYVALRELQARARAGSNTSTAVEEARAEHERIKTERQRAVSSVSYADLGVARHDGTRLRANSNDSEREGLLGDAASMAASSRYHRRDRSASSVISIDTNNSDFPSPGVQRSRGNSRASVRPESPSFQRRASGQSVGQTSPSHDGRAGSSPEMIEHEDLPPHSPPGYENISLNTPLDGIHQEAPPNYSSPVAARGERRPLFDLPRSTADLTGARGSGATHVGQLISDRRASISSGESPQSQRPSLRLEAVPSIHVDSPTPIAQRRDQSQPPQP